MSDLPNAFADGNISNRPAPTMRPGSWEDIAEPFLEKKSTLRTMLEQIKTQLDECNSLSMQIAGTLFSTPPGGNVAPGEAFPSPGSVEAFLQDSGEKISELLKILNFIASKV